MTCSLHIFLLISRERIFSSITSERVFAFFQQILLFYREMVKQFVSFCAFHCYEISLQKDETSIQEICRFWKRLSRIWYFRRLCDDGHVFYLAVGRRNRFQYLAARLCPAGGGRQSCMALVHYPWKAVLVLHSKRCLPLFLMEFRAIPKYELQNWFAAKPFPNTSRLSWYFTFCE